MGTAAANRCWTSLQVIPISPGGQGVCAPGVPTGNHAVVAGHRQHAADAAGLQLGPQPGVGAVDLVAGHPARRDPGVQRVGDHPCGKGQLGRKPNLVGDAGGRQR